MISMNSLSNLNNIIYTIKEEKNSFFIFKEVYIFGSIINNSKYNDIDILLIYENNHPELLIQKKKLEYTLGYKLNCSLDITMLSCSEEREVKFLERINSKYIKIK